MMNCAVRIGLSLLLAGVWLVDSGRVRADFPPIFNTQDPADRPPTPAEAVAAITLPEGFRATLFVGEPDVAQPVAFDLDDRGRLWVVECYTYEKGSFDDQFNDRILIFTDQDNDGRFDSRKVFWDQGQRVTGITFGFGGVWLLTNGRLVMLPDADRDDVPDGDPIVLLDGFDIERAGHNIVNGLLWGPDGWLYGRQGIQGNSLVGAPDAAEYDRKKLNCSIWRFHPVRHEFEVVTHGTTNPWGLDYNDFGEMFFTNNVIGHLWHVVPGAHFQRMYGEDFNPYLYELIDQCADHYHWDTGQSWTDSREGKGVHGELGGGHSHCGGMIYLGDNWPDRYRNSILMCNTHGRRVNRDRLVRHGSGYVGRHEPDFLFANQRWFRGVELKYGPDGGVYVSDWTDLGECHDRDGVHRTSGRIYKVVYGDAPAKMEIDISTLDNSQLVELQLHHNDWFVRHARRVLQERAAEGIDLSAAQNQLQTIFSDHNDVTRQLRAMWALHVTGGIEEPWLQQQLNHPHESIRVWAIRFLLERELVADSTLEMFRRLASDDPSGLVRLYLAAGLQRLPFAQRWPIAVALAEHAEDTADPYLPLMIWYGIEPVVPEQPEQALQLVARTRIPQLRTLIARRLTTDLHREPEPVDRLLKLAISRDDPELRRDLLQGMSAALRGWRKATPPSVWSEAQPVLVRSSDPLVRERTRELALVFGDGRALDELRAIAEDGSKSPDSRRRALEVLIDNRPANLAPSLIRLARDRATDVTAIRGLAAYDHPETAKTVLQQMQRLDIDGRRECVNTLCSRPQFALALLEAVGQGTVPRTEITAYHARQLQTFDEPRIVELLQKYWGAVRETPAEKAQLVSDWKARLTETQEKQADHSNGRLVFKKTCATCHRLYGQGEKIGPDLTGSNRDNLDYLLDNIIDPSAVVAQDYRISNIILLDGRVTSGFVGAETDRTITVQTQEHLLVIDRDDIDEIVPSPLSLMADGLLKPLSDDQVRDLIAYLRGTAQVPLPKDSQEDISQVGF